MKHSVLPRLHIVMNECIAAISEVYRVEVLNDSRVAFSPHFRRKRKDGLSLLYNSAYVETVERELAINS